MGRLNELAERLKDFENPDRIGASIGEVIGLDPLKIRIADGAIDLEEGDELEVCERLKKHTKTVSLSWLSGELTGELSGTVSGDVSGSVSGTVSGPTAGDIQTAELTIDPGIAFGDFILCIPDADEQGWIAVDKVVSVI